jgi:hypothetical protein
MSNQTLIPTSCAVRCVSEKTTSIYIVSIEPTCHQVPTNVFSFVGGGSSVLSLQFTNAKNKINIIANKLIAVIFFVIFIKILLLFIFFENIF